MVRDNDRVVFPADFMARAIEIYPAYTDLHVAIANGDYEKVKSILYNQIATGPGMSASMLSTMPLDEIRKRAKGYEDRLDFYNTCSDILNRYWVTPKA